MVKSTLKIIFHLYLCLKEKLMNYEDVIKKIYGELKSYWGKGKVADYIPALAEINPRQYGIARSEEHTSELQSH